MAQRTTLLSRFRGDTRGGIALMGGLMIGILSTSVIAAVDITEMTVTKQKMQDRLDSTVLYATLQEEFREPGNEQKLQDAARKYLIDSVVSTGVKADSISTDFTYDQTRDRIVGKVNFTPPAIFTGSILVPHGMFVEAEAAPSRPSKLELSLVLDMSGSMNFAVSNDVPEKAAVGSRRIDALRDGVDALMRTLKETEEIEAKYTVVPYATSVDLTEMFDKAGAKKNSWFKGANGKDLPTVCSGGRLHVMICTWLTGLSGRGVEKPSPPGAWGGELYNAKTGDSFSLDLKGPGFSNKIPVVSQGPRGIYCHDSYIETYGERCVDTVKVNGGLYVERDYFAPRVGPLAQTDNPGEVTKYMNTLQAQGATAGHIGAAWGLYALSPEWDEVFRHPTGEPAKFTDPTQKMMIIMTDGDFTVTHDDSMSLQETYAYFQSVCSLARSQGVIVYTVGLRSSALTDAELTKCAGGKENYFPATSREGLIKAFEEIAEKATAVRLAS